MKYRFIIYLIFTSLFLSSCISKILRKSDTYNTFTETSFSDNIIYNDMILTDNNYALLIPLFFENCPDTVFFQLDLGTSQTVLYENALSTLKLDSNKTKVIRGFPYYFKPTLRLNHRDYIIADSLRVFSSSKIENTSDNDSVFKDDRKKERVILGTLGYDFIYPRVVVLDFQNKKYGLIDTIDYSHFNDFHFLKKVSCDKAFMILKIRVGKKNMKVIYDSGSSAWDLAVLGKTWNKFSGEIKDTIGGLNSWGKETILYSKEIYDHLIIGRDTINNFKLYKSNMEENYKSAFFLLGVKGMIGNSLFLDKSIIIDTKNNKFGMKQ